MTEPKKLDRNDFMFVDKEDKLLIKKPGDIFGKNFKIKNLKRCQVYLLDYTSGIFVDDCDDCSFVIGPCSGSVFIRTSNRCQVSIISKQLRFRDCYNMNIFGYCPADPVIESSDFINFGPFNVKFPCLKDSFIKAKFNPFENKIERVYDFCPKEGESHFKWLGDETKVFPVIEIDGLDGLSSYGLNEWPYDEYPTEVLEKYGLHFVENKNNNEVEDETKNDVNKFENFFDDDVVVSDNNMLNSNNVNSYNKNNVEMPSQILEISIHNNPHLSSSDINRNYSNFMDNQDIRVENFNDIQTQVNQSANNKIPVYNTFNNLNTFNYEDDEIYKRLKEQEEASMRKIQEKINKSFSDKQELKRKANDFLSYFMK